MTVTLLSMVQDMLVSLDGTPVNSIADTEESASVASIIKQSYTDLVALWDLPENLAFYELEASGDPTKPTIMYRPAAARSLEWVKYDNKLPADVIVKFRPLTYIPLDNFLEMMYNTIEGLNVVEFQHTVGTASVDLLCTNDKHPEYYTTFDDRTLLFDSYLATEDTTLMKNKTLAYGLTDKTFSMTDGFAFPLDTQQVSLLFNAAKNQAFIELKQAGNPVAAKRERDGLIQMERTKQAVKGTSALSRTPNYGR